MTIIVTPSTSEGSLSALRAQLQARGYGTDTAPTVQNTMLNSVYRRVIGMRRWWFLEVANNQSITTSPGVYRYSLIDNIPDLLHIDGCRAEDDSQQYELTYLRPQHFRSQYNVERTRGAPQHWTRINTHVYVWPVPDSVYTLNIDYVKAPTQLVGDEDLSIVPTAYQDLLVWGAIREMCFRERDRVGWDLANTEYQAIIRDMILQDGLEQRQNPSTVQYSGEVEAVNDRYTVGSEGW